MPLDTIKDELTPAQALRHREWELVTEARTAISRCCSSFDFAPCARLCSCPVAPFCFSLDGAGFFGKALIQTINECLAPSFSVIREVSVVGIVGAAQSGRQRFRHPAPLQISQD